MNIRVAVLSLTFLAACGARTRPAVTGNRAVPESRHVRRVVRLPTPTALPSLGALAVEIGEEKVVRARLCSDNGETMTVREWAAALVQGGFAVQENDGGWRGNGPMALRFRNQHVVADLFANQDAHGCRKYVFRLQLVPVPPRLLSWKTAFGLNPFNPGRCIRFFSRDERFPFDDSEYSWGCSGP